MTESGAVAGEPSQDGNVLIGQLRKLPRPKHGRDSDDEPPRLNRRFQLSVAALFQLVTEEEQMPGRAILVWFGPGWPMLADPKFKHDTAEQQKNFFAHVVDLSTALRESQMTIYNVSTPEVSRGAESGKDLYKKYLGGVPAAKQVNSANLALPVLAYQSGGKILDDEKDLANGLAASIADANSYYALAFDSAPGESVDEYRPLEARVNRPGLSARTTKAYYAQP